MAGETAEVYVPQAAASRPGEPNPKAPRAPRVHHRLFSWSSHLLSVTLPSILPSDLALDLAFLAFHRPFNLAFGFAFTLSQVAASRQANLNPKHRDRLAYVRVP